MGLCDDCEVPRRPLVHAQSDGYVVSTRQAYVAFVQANAGGDVVCLTAIARDDVRGSSWVVRRGREVQLASPQDILLLVDESSRLHRRGVRWRRRRM